MKGLLGASKSKFSFDFPQVKPAFFANTFYSYIVAFKLSGSFVQKNELHQKSKEITQLQFKSQKAKVIE